MSDLSKKIAELLAKYGQTVPVYHQRRWLFFWWKRREGWLWIEDHDTFWTVWVSNFKDEGIPRGGGPVAADIDKATGERWQHHGGFSGAWRTAISAWPVKDEDLAQQIFELVVERINHAHQSQR